MNKDIPVLLIAYQEQDNLGIGYIASLLIKHGYKTVLIDFQLEKEVLLEQIRARKPLVIGFSIIFQYHILNFKEVIQFLRENGINCHFCAGGHFPSLRYNNLFNIIPQLDSIVLFEGELTFLELVDRIYSGVEWKSVRGIAYHTNGEVTANSLRPLIPDLDDLPVPVRKPLKEYALGKKYVTLLAGRGCYFNCSFCSIRAFYSLPPGPIKRVRDPQCVVREMQLLYDRLGASVFMFQDDDFPVTGNRSKEWLFSFCHCLKENELSDKILWKINCRPDEVDENMFRLMKNSGLFLVYLGIESGTDEGLELMNKHMTTATTAKAVNILKRLDIAYDFGFMLFDPSSTFESVIQNLDFLENICGDGSSPLTFCKMLPYAETRIEADLIKHNRLKGDMGFENYDFKEDSLNFFFSILMNSFGDWITRHDGLLNMARWTKYHSLVYKKYFNHNNDCAEFSRNISLIIASSNMYFIDKVKDMVQVFRSNTIHNIDLNFFRIIGETVRTDHELYKKGLNKIMHEMSEVLSPIL